MCVRRTLRPLHLASASLVLLLRLPGARAFIEEAFGQAFGNGGGGGFQFEMGGDPFGDDPFEMGRGSSGPRWPKGYSNKISKKMAWLKGTEWNWNKWRDVKLQKDGTFDAPTGDCQQGQCEWSANKGKVFILWGEAGLHELDVIGEMPADASDKSKLQGLQLRGRRISDGDKCSAAFRRVFDHEAAGLEKDLYEVLGLQDDAEEGDIKKVYRKLSIKYHPDKNPGEEAKIMFAEIRDAYEILNDPDKRILYDTGGMEAVKNAEKGEVQKGEDVSMTLTVTLEDLYNSAQKKANHNRRIVCRGCRLKPDLPRCKGCGRCPNEVKLVNRQMGNMIMQQQVEVESKEKCKKENIGIDVQIERGMAEGESLTFPRMAEQRPNMVPGSVIFTLKTTKHMKFERRGDDLHMAMQVPLRESLLGWSQDVKHLDGHIVTMGADTITKPFQVIKVKNEGMPLRDDPSSFGDLYVKVEVVFPLQLTGDQYKAIEALFQRDPPRPEL